LLQQSLSLEAVTYALTNQLNQILQLALVRRLDVSKPGWVVVPVDVYPVQKQNVEVEVDKVN
jgi:uncharacterized lipoprotein YmbA